MSIFGIKKTHTRRLIPLVGMEDSLSQFKTEMQNISQQMNTIQTNLQNKVENIKPVITVWAEKKGALSKDVFEFGFGNGGRAEQTGYMMMCDGRIKRMAVNVQKERGRAWVMISIDGKEEDDYHILLTGEQTTLKEYNTFKTPLEVKAGSIINFVSKVYNSKIDNCIVGILIRIRFIIFYTFSKKKMKQPTAPLYPELPVEDGQNYRLSKISEIEKQLIIERDIKENII